MPVLVSTIAVGWMTLWYIGFVPNLRIGVIFGAGVQGVLYSRFLECGYCTPHFNGCHRKRQLVNRFLCEFPPPKKNSSHLTAKMHQTFGEVFDSGNFFVVDCKITT